jgi:hypothetical protein
VRKFGNFLLTRSFVIHFLSAGDAELDSRDAIRGRQLMMA